MKHNRSLKDIRLVKPKFQEERPPLEISVSGLSSPSNFAMSIDNLISNMKAIDSDRKPILKHEKSAQSQKNLDIPMLKFQMTSPKHKPQEIHTDRSLKTKDVDNVQISAFECPKSPVFRIQNILSPTNQNRNYFTIEEPKRPKILNKQRQSLSFFQEFKLGKVLGKGRFGNVYRAQHINTKMVVAVKQISLQKVCKKLIERLIWEIKIQSYLKHENCLQLYKYYKESNSLYLVLELGECSLFDKLRQKRYFTEVETCYYITQTIRALKHLHEQGIIHRDLKPQNIVLINSVVKLADFGWSIYIGKNNKRTTFCGTLDYVSPEIVMGAEYDEMVDVWSIGVLCYELSTGHAPFQSTKSRQQTYKKILNVDLKFPKSLSEDIKDFITRLLIKKPQQRMSLDEALNHRWVKKYFMK